MNLANKITLARVILVPVFIVLLMASRIPGLSGLVENGIKLVCIGSFYSCIRNGFFRWFHCKKI